MKRPVLHHAIPVRLACLFVIILVVFTSSASPANDKKVAAIASIERERAGMIQLSDQVWRFAELSLLETFWRGQPWLVRECPSVTKE